MAVRAPLAPGERLVRFTARTLGAGGAWSRHGRILLGHLSVRPHRGFRVRFSQTVLVKRHRESFSFTNVYRAC